MEIIDLTDPDFEPSPQVAGLPTGKAADHSQPPSGASLSGLAQVKPDTMAVEPPSAASPVAPASGPLAGGPGSAPDGSGTAGNSSNSNGNGNGIGTTSTSDAMQIDEPRNPVGPPNSTADNNTIGRGNGSSNVTYSNTDQANGSSVAQPPSETAPCLSPLLPGTDYASVRRIQIHLNLADTRKNVFNMDSLLLTDAESNAKISLFAPTRQAPGSGRQLDDDPKDSDDMSVSGAEPDDNRGEADAPKKKRKRRRRQDEEDEYDLDDDFIDDGDLFYDDEDGFVDFDSDPNTAAKIWEYGYFAWKGPIESYFSWADERSRGKGAKKDMLEKVTPIVPTIDSPSSETGRQRLSPSVPSPGSAEASTSALSSTEASSGRTSGERPEAGSDRPEIPRARPTQSSPSNLSNGSTDRASTVPTDTGSRPESAKENARTGPSVVNESVADKPKKKPKKKLNNGAATDQPSPKESSEDNRPETPNRQSQPGQADQGDKATPPEKSGKPKPSSQPDKTSKADPAASVKNAGASKPNPQAGSQSTAGGKAAAAGAANSTMPPPARPTAAEPRIAAGGAPAVAQTNKPSDKVPKPREAAPIPSTSTPSSQSGVAKGKSKGDPPKPQPQQAGGGGSAKPKAEPAQTQSPAASPVVRAPPVVQRSGLNKPSQTNSGVAAPTASQASAGTDTTKTPEPQPSAALKRKEPPSSTQPDSKRPKYPQSLLLEMLNMESERPPVPGLLHQDVLAMINNFRNIAKKETVVGQTKLPLNLHEPLSDICKAAMDQLCINESFIGHLMMALPYSAINVKRLVERIVLREQINTLCQRSNVLYPEFQKNIELYVKHHNKKLQDDKSKSEQGPATGESSGANKNRSTTFRFAPLLTDALMELIDNECEMARLNNALSKLGNKDPQYFEEKVQQAFYEKIVKFWPPGMMTIDHLKKTVYFRRRSSTKKDTDTPGKDSAPSPSPSPSPLPAASNTAAAASAAKATPPTANTTPARATASTPTPTSNPVTTPTPAATRAPASAAARAPASAKAPAPKAPAPTPASASASASAAAPKASAPAPKPSAPTSKAPTPVPASTPAPKATAPASTPAPKAQAPAKVQTPKPTPAPTSNRATSSAPASAAAPAPAATRPTKPSAPTTTATVASPAASTPRTTSTTAPASARATLPPTPTPTHAHTTASPASTPARTTTLPTPPPAPTSAPKPKPKTTAGSSSVPMSMLVSGPVLDPHAKPSAAPRSSGAPPESPATFMPSAAAEPKPITSPTGPKNPAKASASVPPAPMPPASRQ